MGTHEYKFNSKHENLICLLNMILLYQLITHTWCAVIALDFVLSFHIYMGMCNFVCLISYLYKTTSIIYNDDVTEISPFKMIMRIRKCSSGILVIFNQNYSFHYLLALMIDIYKSLNQRKYYPILCSNYDKSIKYSFGI